MTKIKSPLFIFLSGLVLANVAPFAAQGERDPTRPLLDGIAVKAETPFQLMAIMERNGQRFAIINGKIVHLGHKIRDAKILKIAPDKVVLERKGQQFTLHWLRPSLKGMNN